MNATWKTFLTRSGARLDDGAVIDFGDPRSEARAASGAGVVCDLSHRGLIAVEGEEAMAFLQGQLTCDLSQVSPSRSRVGAWCSPKGRVLTVFRVIDDTDRILLELPAEQVEAIIKRMNLYVLRSRVALKNVSDESVRLGLAGEPAVRLLEEAPGAAPSAPDNVAAAGGARVIRLRGAPPRFQYIGDPAGAEDLWRRAAGTLAPAGRRVWSLLEILAGVPEQALSDAHLPQMINLDALDGMSFEKGCYVGQEVVARTRHLGRLKRRMYLIAGSGVPPAPGAPVIDPDSGSEAGQIVSSAPQADGGGFVALAVLRIDAATGGLRLSSADGPKLEVLTLPYTVGGASA